jgi:hypothetical protein
MRMSVLNKIAYFQNRRDEVPNQRLAAELAKTKDTKGIREIAENLRNGNPNIQADCLKVLYEIGCINPKLVSGYVDDFLELLKSKNNRLVWGAMIGLSTIAGEQSAAIGSHADAIMETMNKGSVITVDNGIRTLAVVASKQPRLKKRLVAFLFDHLRMCRAKDVPQHSEKILVAVDSGSKSQFIKVLESRLSEFNASQARRVSRLIRRAQGM